ncbi:MAG: hypothetical protein AABZ53_04590 [Planctomycetota bacterium]
MSRSSSTTSPSTLPERATRTGRTALPQSRERLAVDDVSPMLFLGEFFRSPLRIGALYQSPPRIARALAVELGLESAAAVAEFGPGTGPVTREILSRIPADCRFFAVERNRRLARAFRTRFPGVTLYEDSAEHVRELCGKSGIDRLDAVVTSIPWIVLPPSVQESMLLETTAMLRPGGRFNMITYRSPSSVLVRRMMAQLQRHFSVVEPNIKVRSRVSSAFICRCTK